MGPCLWRVSRRLAQNLYHAVFRDTILPDRSLHHCQPIRPGPSRNGSSYASEPVTGHRAVSVFFLFCSIRDLHSLFECIFSFDRSELVGFSAQSNVRLSTIISETNLRIFSSTRSAYILIMSSCSGLTLITCRPLFLVTDMTSCHE